MRPTSEIPADNEFLHGTHDSSAIQILYEGFKLKRQSRLYGRWATFGQAIYLTKSVVTASLFGTVVFRCRLKDNVSVLRVNEAYDQKTIEYLKREFGKEILTGDIGKAVPHNKHLTRGELIHLINYRFKSKGKRKPQDVPMWHAVVASIRQQLQRHKYDAVGETQDMVGVAVFNPSLVEALEPYQMANRDGKQFLEVLDKGQFAFELARNLSEWKVDCDTRKERDYWDHVETLLKRFCRENGLERE